jgi:hypothetical protein
MNFTISPDRKTLTIFADEPEREALRGFSEAIQQDAMLHDVLEPLTCNSELQWVRPEDTGDLTDAPMLGIFGPVSDAAHVPFPSVNVGHWDGRDWAQKIESRWAFMDYQVRSPLEDLRDKGQAVFVGGDL